MIPFLSHHVIGSPSVGFAILGCTIFLKTREITEINTKSSNNAYEIYVFVNRVLQFDQENVWLDLHEI